MITDTDSLILEELEDEETENAISSFRTYKNYLRAISLFLDDNYDTPTYKFLENECKATQGYRWVLQRSSGVRRLNNRETENIRRLLFNAWHTEFLLALPKEKYPHLIRYSNHWSPVQAYYAVFLALQAYIEASRRERPRNHSVTLRIISEDIVTRKVFPQPWASVCKGCVQIDDDRYIGLPDGVSGAKVCCLSNPMTGRFWDWYAMFLRTTRKRQFEEKAPAAKKRFKTKTGKARKNLLTQHKKEIDSSIHATTLFDGLYRLRLRSNYKDADAFMLGTLSDQDAEIYFNSLLDVTHSSLYLLELYIEAYLGESGFADLVRGFVSICKDFEEDHPIRERWP